MESLSYIHPEQPAETRYEILTAEFMRSIRNTHRTAALFKKDYGFYTNVAPPTAAVGDHTIDVEEYIARQMIMSEDTSADWERSRYFSAHDIESGTHIEITHYEGFALNPDTGATTHNPKDRVEVEISLSYQDMSDMEFKLMQDGGLGSLINDVVRFELDEDGILILPDQAGYLISAGIFEDEIEFLDFYTTLIHAAQSEEPYEAYEIILKQVAAYEEASEPIQREITADLTFEEELAYFINRAETIAEISDFIIDSSTNPSSEFFGNHNHLFESTRVGYIHTCAFGNRSEDERPTITDRRIATNVSDIEYLIDQSGSDIRVYGVILDSAVTYGAFNELVRRFLDNPRFDLPALAEDPRHFETFGFRLEPVDDVEIAWVLQAMHDAIPTSRQDIK